VILVVTLLYWGREALRDYDRVATHDGQAVAVGMIPAPTGTPPEGVHIPPPSFRPVLIALSMTMLVAGLIVGGWALVLGAVALAITMLEWLWDARKEYQAVEDADRTGHLDLGPAPSWPTATFAALAVLVAVAVVFSSGILPNSGSEVVPSVAPGEGGEAGGGGGGEAPATEAPALPDADFVVTAENIAYLETALTVPADTPFTIAFDNRDTVPHDIVIKDGGGATVFQGEVITGPAVVVYDVPALPAGAYGFVCSIHPNMTGSITAQ
jgi:plastocyanin